MLAVAGAVTGAAAGGCGRERPPGVISDSAYVETMARLVSIQRGVETARDVTETAGADSARRAVFREGDVTGEELRRYAEAYGGDPEHMKRIWERIEEKVGALQQEERGEGGPRIERRPPGDMTPRDSAAPGDTAPPPDTASRGDTAAPGNAAAPGDTGVPRKPAGLALPGDTASARAGGA